MIAGASTVAAARRFLARAAFVALAALAFAPVGTRAQYAQDFGPYRVRYSAIPTDRLLPEMARAYGIERSPRRSLVNIAVERVADGKSDLVHAAVEGTATPLTGERVVLKFREINESGTVSYIADFAIGTPDTYRFNIKLAPDGASTSYRLEFSQDFAD